jgi:hypothetical protein
MRYSLIDALFGKFLLYAISEIAAETARENVCLAVASDLASTHPASHYFSTNAHAVTVSSAGFFYRWKLQAQVQLRITWAFAVSIVRRETIGRTYTGR